MRDSDDALPPPVPYLSLSYRSVNLGARDMRTFSCGDEQQRVVDQARISANYVASACQ
jgi:hypothetical protein